ncbi:hypothetical protein ABKN59_004663 [Abortiporus biennis]
MDDLYNNAWGDPVKIDDEPAFNAWGSRRTSHLIQHEEADLAAPSWSTGNDIRWNEPSEDSSGFGWSKAEPDVAWGTSTYEGIQIGKTLPPQDEDAKTVVPSEEEEDEVPTHSFNDVEPIPRFPSRSPSPISTPAISVPDTIETTSSTSPDVFGGFASASETSDTPALKAPDLDADAWGSAWASESDDVHRSDSNDAVDEWEAAKQEREKLDRVVPEEVRTKILDDCEAFCNERWPIKDDDLQTKSDQDSWRNNIRTGMREVKGFDTLMDQYFPRELPSHPPVNFSKTNLAKKRAAEIRLTRNLPIVKESPWSYYMASKGSTTWEKAVKAHKDAPEDDVVPAGWRVLDKDTPVETKAVKAQKTSSGFFSFWGRKDAKPSVSTASISSTSSASVSRSQSPAALDKSKSSPGTLSQSNGPSSPTKSSSEDVMSPTSLMSPPGSADTPFSSGFDITSPPTSASYADAPVPLEMDRSQSSPAPSAVSRFLNRFSSHRRSALPSSAHSSLALSSDDLEFLSDIVPSAGDEADDEPLAGSAALANLIKPEPLPPMLPPPPANVPLPQSRPSSAARSSGDSFKSSGVNPNKALPRVQHNHTGSSADELDSFFDALQTDSPKASTPPIIQSYTGSKGQSSLSSTSILPPPPSSRPQSPAAFVLQRSSRPASPSPLSGILHPPVPRPSSQPLIPSPSTSRSSTPTGHRREGSSQSVQIMVKRPSIELGINTHHTSLPPRPKIPSSFTSSQSSTRSSSPASSLGSIVVSRPPSTVPPTPSSAVPLGELYPNAVKRPSSVEPPSLFDPVSNPSQFIFAPPPTHSHPTVLAPKLAPPPRASSIPPLLPPPASSISRPSSTKSQSPASFDLFEDDDFADFQSSATLPSTSSQPSKPLSSSSRPILPPPPLTGTPSNMHNQPLLPPPVNDVKSRVTKPMPVDPFDDFADFHDSPSTSTQLNSSFEFDTSFSAKQGLLPSKLTIPDFEETQLDTPSSLLRTPSPPRVPSKFQPPPKLPPPPMFQSTPPVKQPVSQVHTSHSHSASKSKVAPIQHDRTMSLLDFAASKSGVWPALSPSSPLPEGNFSIPAPPGSVPNKSSVDLMGEDDSFGSFNAGNGVGILSSSFSSPAVLAPSNSSRGPTPSNSFIPTLQSIPQSQTMSTVSSTNSGQWLFGMNNGSMNGNVRLGINGGASKSSSSSLGSIGQSKSSSSILPPPMSSTKISGGGLSAQDLSFFEGL